MALGLEKAVADHLVANGVRTAVGTDIFVAELPETPDEATLVKLDGGPAPTDVVEEIQQFTVRTRSEKYETAMQKAREVHKLLHNTGGTFTVGAVTFTVAKFRADFLPNPLGRDGGDDAGRWEVTQTFTAITTRIDLN